MGVLIEFVLESLLGIENDGLECLFGLKDMEKLIVNVFLNVEIDGKRDYD